MPVGFRAPAWQHRVVPTDPVVTRVRPGDEAWAAYVGLFADYRAHYAQAAPEHEASDAWLRTHLASGQLACYLAGTPHGPAAMALVVAGSPASLALGVFWQLRDLWVAPEQRRAGIARAVVMRVADDARQAGALRLALMTETDNLPAQALYGELGFEMVTSHVSMLLTL